MGLGLSQKRVPCQDRGDRKKLQSGLSQNVAKEVARCCRRSASLMGEPAMGPAPSAYGSQRVRTLKRGEAPAGQVSIKTLSSPAHPRRNVQQEVEKE